MQRPLNYELDILVREMNLTSFLRDFSPEKSRAHNDAFSDYALASGLAICNAKCTVVQEL
jgi:hypothetical protein